MDHLAPLGSLVLLDHQDPLVKLAPLGSQDHLGPLEFLGIREDMVKQGKRVHLDQPVHEVNQALLASLECQGSLEKEDFLGCLECQG